MTERLLSHQFHTSLIYMLKQLDLPKKIRETSLTVPPPNSLPEVVDKAWKDWVQVETWKRYFQILSFSRRCFD